MAATPLAPPLHELPEGWAAIREDAIGAPFDLVVDNAYMWSNYDTQTVDRVDPDSLHALEPFTFGSEPGTFPPDVQTIAPGNGGVWVTLASQRAVVLFDPTSGTELRRIEVDGYPYTILEDGTDLWVGDFENNVVLRVDLATGKVTATIRVAHVTDLAVGGGSVWATVHDGRAAEHEPIEGNGGQIARIDPATNEVTLIDVGPRPYFLAVGFGSLWTGNATGGSVSRIDMATNEPTTISIFQDGAFDIEVVGDSVWVVVGPQWGSSCRSDDPDTSFFVRIDPASNAVERIASPCPFGITPAGDGAWITGRGDDGWIARLLEPSAPSPTMQLFDAEDIPSLVPQDGDFDGADYTFSVGRCPGGASLDADLGLAGRGSVGMQRDDSTADYPFIFGAWVSLWADAAAASAALAAECPWSQQPVIEPIELPAGRLGDGGRCAVIDWGTLADRGWCQFAVSNATFEMYIRTNTNGTDLHPDAAADLAALAVALKERAEGLATGP